MAGDALSPSADGGAEGRARVRVAPVQVQPPEVVPRVPGHHAVRIQHRHHLRAGGPGCGRV